MANITAPKGAARTVESELIPPDPQLYSLVLRYQGLALGLGRMPKIEPIAQTTGKLVPIPKTF